MSALYAYRQLLLCFSLSCLFYLKSLKLWQLLSLKASPRNSVMQMTTVSFLSNAGNEHECSFSQDFSSVFPYESIQSH